MRWTEPAKTAAKRVLTQADADSVDAAIAYAEQLADNVGSSFVDVDLWRQAWRAVSQARRLARHHPPALHHDTQSADAN